MPVKLVSDKFTNLIHPSDMKDGQLAIIRDWSSSTVIGLVVQRVESKLVIIGEPSSRCFPDICKSAYKYSTSICKVEILPTGTMIEVC